MLLFVSKTVLSAPIVWKMHDANRQFYVLGSIHAGNNSLYPLPDIFLNQWDNADALIVEANILRPSSALNAPHAPPFTQQRLTLEQQHQLDRIAKTLSLPTPYLLNQPPWLTAMMLQLALANKLNLTPEQGIDYVLLKKAHHQQLPIKQLESLEYQINLLKNLPNNGTDMLLETLSQWHDAEQSLHCLVTAWKHGDSDKLTALFKETQHDAATNETLIFARNKHWVTTLSQSPAYKTGHFLVVVGVFHLIGEQGLPALMQQAGFTVERITEGTAAQCQHDVGLNSSP